ncbi:hypothetical protein [Kutzneria sp. CA-103260]|uniref:hypothetical protein n=1 Tax=Kutzneria sp. CA-103260 TaxID=2802641 RepID=UPI001BA6622A|nr:hypothetical protein [Kutzneria sp. CA-103260]QUQ66616.1 hypothetical protein JJ691_43440 [Kutzneria sp. CA-103260]
MEGHQPPGPKDRFEDDLIGLDRDDPEVKAFAEHLDRMERVRNGYTVEGYLAGVTDFAESANRSSGHRRLMVGLVVLLILLGVGFATWNLLTVVLGVIIP